MTTYKQASEVIEKNQKAVVLFTHGDQFSYDSAGNGSTGEWIVNPDIVEDVDRVIVYLRRDDETVNRIFLGDYAGVQKSDITGRHTIRFSALKEVGTTESNWPEFANGGQYPVRYVIA